MTKTRRTGRLLALAGVLLFGLGAGRALAADTGRIVGTVTDATAKAPVPGGVVVALQEGKVVAVAALGAKGTYALEGLAGGAYEVMALAPGYLAETRQGVEVKAGGNTSVDFALSAPPAPAAPAAPATPAAPAPPAATPKP